MNLYTKYILLLIFILIKNILVLAQESAIKKQVSVLKIQIPPIIDGKPDDDCWLNAQLAGNFLQFKPYTGKPATLSTEVRMAYDNYALYLFAQLCDSSPDSIDKRFSKRDEIDNSDFFGVYIDPFNDGVNAYGFFVSAAGVQVDIKSTKDGEDPNWDAVWDSEILITNKGWQIEMRIPYSALRFPKKEIQLWSINMLRNIERLKEKDSWNLIDPKVKGLNNQFGEISGILGIIPPLRLSFYPYLSGYVDKTSEISGLNYYYKGGMDVKYGINESFTLDMMLIPDFGQVQSDDERLNLTPYEIKFNEKRQFFTEGTELFNKGQIFYSRRIGGDPVRRNDVENNLKNNEIIIENPTEVQLINATKLSGKTLHGLGIGFLNAMAGNTYSTIKDTVTGDRRKFCTQPFTNYNMFVFDQSFKNNSFASLTNTNVYRPDDNFYANVTATEFNVENKNKKYGMQGNAALSQVREKTGETNNSATTTGYRYYLQMGKISGNWTYNVWQNIESDTYNPNHLGYLQQNNEFSNGINIRYNLYEPFWKVLGWYNNLNVNYLQLYDPRKYTSFEILYNMETTLRNNFTTGINVNLYLKDRHDYFEARVDNRLFIVPSSNFFEIWGSSDYRKTFALDCWAGYTGFSNYDMKAFNFGFGPRFRFSDRFTVICQWINNISKNDRGFVDNTDNNLIVFGQRNVRDMENIIESAYIFNNKASISFRLRHYWSKVEYNQFFKLEHSGYLSDYPDYTQNQNINFNAFTIDMAYIWNFAPGSEMSLVWKNSIYTEGNEIVTGYYDNLNNTWRSSQTNSLSFKILYYIDFLTIKRNRSH